MSAYAELQQFVGGVSNDAQKNAHILKKYADNVEARCFVC